MEIVHQDKVCDTCIVQKSSEQRYLQNYIKFFNLIKKSPEQLIRQLEFFLFENKYFEKLIIKNILLECNIHKYPDIINKILFNITKYKSIYEILNIIYILFELGADINHTIDLYNNTILHKASFEGNKYVCLILIKLGSNINLLNLSNETPLDRFGKILDRSLNQFTNIYKLECCSLFTREANWLRRRNYILFVEGVKKLFMDGEQIKPFSYRFIMCHDVIRYIASFI